MSPNGPLDLGAARQIRHDDVVDNGVVRSLLPLLPRLRYVNGMRQEADALHHVSEMCVRVHGLENTIYVPHGQAALSFDVQVQEGHVTRHQRYLPSDRDDVAHLLRVNVLTSTSVSLVLALARPIQRLATFYPMPAIAPTSFRPRSESNARLHRRRSSLDPSS